MYRITYIHKDSETENPLYTAGDQEYCLTDARANLQMGMAGELNIYVPEINPARYDIECLTDEVVLYRNEKEIFRGRPVTAQMDFNKTGHLTCEGILAYLYDTYFEPFEFEGSPKELFTLIIENHNSHVEERKRFVVGDITVIDNNDYINRSSIYYDRSLNVMTEKLIKDSLGGYFRVRVEDGVRYIDYLEDYATQATQMVQYGENILDIATEVEYSDLATVILPLGARLEDEDGSQTDEYTTIASVNGGSIYYEDPEAVAEYGWICVCVEWEDVTIPDNLLTKAKAYLEQVTNAVQSFTINAVDLALISEEYEAIEVGDYVYVRSIEHGINQYIELTSMTLYLLAPENDVLQFGGDTSTLTDAQRNNDRNVQTALGSLSMRVTNLTATVINAVYANIEEIVSSMITTDVIRAAVADLGYVTADYLEANYLDAEYIEANFLAADSAVITDLTAFAANIYTLLGGEGAFGELQSIHLTSDNAVIDSAVIMEALVGTVLADIINSNVIYTNQITIMSEDGGIVISGNQIQVVNGQTIYYDENGNPRLQIGLDASGNFTFVLYDETGTGIMIDSEGIHESAVPDGLIVDSMVSDDAAISGWKLDIESVTTCLNQYGQLEMDASKVTINDTTLDAWYTTVTQELEGLEGLSSEGLMRTEPWFCLWRSDTEAPPDDDYLTPAICGQAICGRTICGMTSGTLWVDYDIPVTEGKYKWVKWKGYYIDGHEEWGDPYCLTDGYLRQETSVLQTQLEVVQGQISAKVWMTDIVEEITVAMSDMWSEINITLDGIEASVGKMSTESLRKATAYFCLWHSAIDPPPDSSSLTPAICGQAICGRTICGLKDVENFWTTDEPVAGENEYKWIRYFYEYADGHTEWGDPYCLTDEFTREEFESMQGEYLAMESRVSEIEVTVDGITSTVYYVQQTIEGLESSMNEQFSQIEQTMNGITSTVVDLQSVIDEQGEQITSNASQITQLADSITSVVESFNTELEGVESSLKSEIEQLAGSISLTVSGGLGSTASIVMTVGEQETEAALDLAGVRQAFADDETAIVVQAGLVAFLSNTFTVTSTYFQVTEEGYIYAYAGEIGGWTIGLSSLYNRLSSMTAYTSGMYVGIDGIRSCNGDDYLNVTSGYIENGSNTGSNMCQLYSGSLRFYYGTTDLGHFQSVYLTSDPSIRGINMGLQYTGDYISLGYQTESGGSYHAAMRILGAKNPINNYYEHVQFYDTVLCLNDLEMEGNLIYLNKSTDNMAAIGYGVFSFSSGDSVTAVFVQNNLRTVGALGVGGFYRRSGNLMDLSVSGEAYISGHLYMGEYIDVPNAGIALNNNYGVYHYLYSSTTFVKFEYLDTSNRLNLGNADYITILRGSSVYLNGTSTAVTSDLKFKDDVEEFVPDRDELFDKLTPREYTSKFDGETHMGFVAQEVETAMTEAGMDPEDYGLTAKFEDEDGEEVGAIRYEEFIPLLVYEIQKLKSEIQELKGATSC